MKVAFALFLAAILVAVAGPWMAIGFLVVALLIYVVISVMKAS